MHEAIGRSHTLDCTLDPARAAALHVILGLNGPAPAEGDPLPPFWHQIYFWDPLPAEKLGRDGHIKIGGFIPDLGLPRRMWAGGRLEFHAPLRIGTPAEKRITIESVALKDGRSGPLAFITVRHEVYQNGKLCLKEHQDLVYREDPDTGAPKPIPPVARTDEDTRENHSFNSTLLFRYSALTLNGHRIHYDETYSREVEGYDGLVVHGPLLAQLLMHMAERELGSLKTFSFLATAPVMHSETVTCCKKGADMWVRGPDGRQCMQATAS